MKNFIILFCLSLLPLSCAPDKSTPLSKEGAQSKIIRDLIKSVNQRNADMYVEHVAENFRAYLEGELKVDGKEALRQNRAKHLERFPNIHSEIQHLVEIDNKVIMHDKLWLHGKSQKSNDIVEIFTFENGKIVRMDVLQPKNLLD